MYWFVHLTQGAVSQQIRRLEETLGRSLFERDRRGLRLTLSGERLFELAKRLLSQNDEIWARWPRAPSKAGCASACRLI